MPFRKTLIAIAAVGFGITVAAGPALAASSQPRQNTPSKVSPVKGGASTKHKRSAIDPS